MWFIPSSLEELLSFLGESGDARVVAGGTDWLLKRKKVSPDTAMTESALIDLSAVPELRGIFLSKDFASVVVGAAESLSAVAASPLLRRYAACFAMAAAEVGSWQIRNRATPGGNLANASPAADTPSALAALDTVVEIFSPRGVRKISVPEVLGGPNKNTLRPDEVIAAFHIPAREGRVSAFGKIGCRSEVRTARLTLAVSAAANQGVFEDGRVFVGTLGSAALRCPGAERALARNEKSRSAAFREALADAVDEAIPGRGTRTYKRSAIQALGEDVLAKLSDAAGGERT
jgi:carbon-monoxide dehydrogenase medium subunit